MPEKETPRRVQIKGGWAAHGDGWAVHGKTKEAALQRFGEALVRHMKIAKQPYHYEP